MPQNYNSISSISIGCNENRLSTFFSKTPQKHRFQCVWTLFGLRGVKLESLSQSLIDTTTETGEFVFKLFALLAEHERKRLIRRTMAGQAAARARGRMGGRPKGLSPRYQEITSMVIDAYNEKRSIREIMTAFKIPSTTTVYKIIQEYKLKLEETAKKVNQTK